MHKCLSVRSSGAEKRVCVRAVERVLQNTQQAFPEAELDPRETGPCPGQRLFLVFPHRRV